MENPKGQYVSQHGFPIDGLNKSQEKFHNVVRKIFIGQK